MMERENMDLQFLNLEIKEALSEIGSSLALLLKKPEETTECVVRIEQLLAQLDSNMDYALQFGIQMEAKAVEGSKSLESLQS